MKQHVIAWLITMMAVQAESTLALSVLTEKPEVVIEENSYYFVGAGLVTFIDGEPYPVIGVSEKRINAKFNNQIKKVKMSAPIGLILLPCISKEFIEIENFKFGFVNMRAARAEARMLSELSFSQSASDAEIADLRDFNRDPIPDQDLVYQEEGYRELLENQVEDRRMHQDSIADTLNLRFNLKPNTDMRDVYLVCGVSFDLEEGSAKPNQRGSRMAIEFLGDLEGGVSETIRIHKVFPRFQPLNAKCELFFFKGEAEAIAHTQSKGLRKLNKTEAEQLTVMINES